MLLIPVEFSTLNEYLLMEGFGKDEELHYDENGYHLTLPIRHIL